MRCTRTHTRKDPSCFPSRRVFCTLHKERVILGNSSKSKNSLLHSVENLQVSCHQWRLRFQSLRCRGSLNITLYRTENRHKTYFNNHFFGTYLQNLCFLSLLTPEPLVVILLSGPVPYQFMRHKSFFYHSMLCILTTDCGDGPSIDTLKPQYNTRIHRATLTWRPRKSVNRNSLLYSHLELRGIAPPMLAAIL
jgi:hypothetical protein